MLKLHLETGIDKEGNRKNNEIQRAPLKIREEDRPKLAFAIMKTEYARAV